MKKIIWQRNGVKYQSIVRATGKNALEIAITKKGIGRSEILTITDL